MAIPPNVAAGLEGVDREYIQRLKDEFNQLGLTRSAREAYMTQSKGMSAGAQQIAAGIGLEIDAFNKQQQAAAKSASALEKMNAGVQKLPGQFLGVFTALQAGQDPVTTLLAQGLRMVETFGSVGAAANGAGVFVAGLANPIGIAAAAVGALAVAYVQGAAEAEAFNKTLILSGNAVGASSDSMMDAAQSIDALNFGITQSRAAEVINTIAASGNVGAESLERFAQTALAFEKAGGGSAESVAKAFSSLAGDPLGGLESLNKSMNFLTLETYNQVKALTEQGRTVEAAKVAQEAYADAIDTRVPGLVQNLGLVEKAWQAIKGTAAEAWDSVVGIGRATTNKQKMDAAFDEIKRIQDAPSFVVTDASRNAQLKTQWDIVHALEQEAIATQRSTAEKKKQNDATKAGIALSKEASEHDTKAERMQRGVLAATSKFETVLANPKLSEPERKQAEADYLKVVSGITEGNESKPKEVRDRPAAISLIQSQSQSQKQSQEAVGKKELEELLKVRQLVANQRNKEFEDAAAAVQADEQAAAKSIQSVQERITGLQSEQMVLEKSRSLNVSLAEAVEIVAIERLKEQQLRRGAGTEGWQTLQIEIDKRQELLSVMGTKVSREKSDEADKKAAAQSEEAAKKAQEQWKATADTINKSLTDAFMKSLESGKDFGKNLGNALKEQFKSLVLKPTISAVMSPISGMLSTAVSGIMGVGGPGSSGTNLLGLANTASTGYSAYSALTSTGGSLSAIGAYANGTMSGANTVGSIFANATGTGIDGLLATNGAYGTAGGAGAGAGMGALATAGIVIAVMAAVANILGVFKTDTKIGSGLVGTLGNGSNLTPWEEWREGGSLASGPSFSTHNPLESLKKHKEQLQALRDAGQGASAQAMALQAVVTQMTEATKGLADATKLQSEAIQKGYGDLRKNVVRMGDNLGLAGDSVKSFAYTLAQQDLNFDGLKPEEVQAKISAVMGKAGANLAEQLLGRYKDVTETVYDTIQTQQASEAFDPVFVQNERVVTRKEYEASEFAKTGETALDTLTRLSDRFTAVNDASEAMGFGLHIASLAAADFASGIVDAFGGLERFAATTGSFVQNFYTGEEQRQAMASQGSRALKAAGVNLTPEQLLGGSRESVKTGMQDWIATGVDAESYAPVMEILNRLSPLWASYESAAPAVESLTNAVDEMTQKFTGAKDALLSDAKSLAVDLLRAKGDEAGAKALEKANYLSQFDGLDVPRRKELGTQYDANAATRRAVDVQNERNGLQGELNALTDDSAQALTRQRDALDESNRALFDNVQAVKLQKTIAQELPGVLDKYMLPAQRRKAQYGSVAADLTAAGIGVTADQLSSASKGEFAAAATAVYNLGTTTDGMRLALLRAAGVMADIKDAEVDEAFANLQRVVGLQLEEAQETKDRVKAVFDLVKSSVDELYSEVDSTARLRAAEGQDTITQALATARSTGELMDAEKLGEAISAARSGMDGTQYASQFERDKERLVLAGKLSDLEEISGEQLSEAERQVTALEDLVKDGQAQIDELRGINGGVGDVAGAVRALTDAINGRNTVASTPTPATRIDGKGLASFDTLTGVGTTKTGVHFEREALLDAASEVLKAAPDGSGAMSIYKALESGGYSLADYNTMFGMPAGTLEAEALKLGMNVFHRGTPFVPNTGFALLQRGEAVVPTAYNPFVHGRSLGDTARLEAHLEKLTGEVMRLQTLQTLGNTHAQTTVELLDNVTEGGNGMRAEIMNKVELAA